MSTTHNPLHKRIVRLLAASILTYLLWGTPVLEPSVQARDPQPSTQARHDEPNVSRWDGLELWAQRKRPTRAQRRRAAQERRARARKAKQEDAATDETAEAEGKSTAEGEQTEASTLEHKLGAGQSLQRSNEMQFDDRLIRGEKAGSGAVILFDRRARRLPRLTRDRRNFFQQTVRTVLGKREN